ncbi:MAG: ATP-binding protein [Candidatus Margulisiibacteriota bacterium]|jgi:PAS domain S-box-containing protein
MNYSFAVLDFLGAFLAASSAIVIIARNPKDKLCQAFFGYAMMIGFFNLFNALMMTAASMTVAFLHTRFAVVFWILFLLFFVQFCLIVAKLDRDKYYRAGLFVITLAAASVNYLNFTTDWFYKIPVMTAYGYSDLFGRWYWVFVLCSIVMVLIPIYLLTRAWRETKSKREKRQSQTILAALIIGLLVGALLDGFLPTLGVFVQSTAPFISTLYVLVFAYAITRYGLLNVTPANLANDILNMIPGLLLFADVARKIRLANHSLLRNLGYSRDEIIGQDCSILHADQKNHEELHLELARVGTFSQKKALLLTKTGEPMPVNVEAAEVKDVSGEKIGEIFLFIDARKEESLLKKQQVMIEELTKTKERMLSILEDTTEARDDAKNKSEELALAIGNLKEVDRMKNRFMTVMSHELRTPLTPIKGFSSMLLDGQLGQLSEPQANAVTSIQRESDHLSLLIDSILDLAKLESGRRLELNTEPISMRRMLDEFALIVKPQCALKEQTLELVVPDDFNTIIGDRSKLHRLLTNVIGNAINFTPNGGKISIVGQNVENGVELRVIDNGIGIEAQYLEKIFERFFQIDNSYSRATGGVGLGLAISRAIVEAHGGKIRAESKGIGWGTAIIINLPVGGNK